MYGSTWGTGSQSRPRRHAASPRAYAWKISTMRPGGRLSPRLLYRWSSPPSWCSSEKPDAALPSAWRYATSERSSVTRVVWLPSREASTLAMVPSSGSSNRVSWVVRVRAIATAAARRSVRARQPQHVLGQVVERHLLGHRGDLVQAHLAPQALDVELLRVAEASERLQRGVARVEAGLGGEQLRGVRLLAARPAAVEQPRGLEAHGLGGVELRGRVRQRMRDRLVLADGAVEHHAFLGVGDGAIERGAADADGLDADHDALRVERVEQVVEALADRADHVLLGDLEVLDDDLVGVDGGPPQLGDLAHADRAAVEIREEERHAPERLRGVAVAGPRQQQDLVRVLCVGGPHLAAVHHEAIAAALGAGLNARRVGAGVGLGDAEGHDGLARADRRQVLPLHRLGPVLDDRRRREHVEVDRRGAGRSRARGADLVEHQRRLG